MTIKTPIILAVILAGTIGYRQVKSTGQILGMVMIPTPTPTATPTPLPTPVPTRTPTPTPSPTPRPTLTPTPTPIPQPKFSSEQMYEFTNRFGGQYGVDPNVLRHVALCESGFRADAHNYIYAGLYQFDTRTWATYRKLMSEDANPDLRYNAEEAVQTAAYAMSLGKLHLWPNCRP